MVTAAQRAKARPVMGMDSPVMEKEGEGYSRGLGLVPLPRPPTLDKGWESDEEL